MSPISQITEMLHIHNCLLLWVWCVGVINIQYTKYRT